MVVQDPDFKLKPAFELIGVPINVTKSKVATTMGNFTEFVSRNSWNEFDISLIAPDLLIKYRQDDYYIITLLNHLRERGLDFNIDNLLDIKIETLSNEGLVKRSEKTKGSKNHILTLASLLQYGMGNQQFVDDPHYYLSKLSSKETKTILSNLALIPLMKLYFHYQTLSDRDSRIAHERLYVMYHNFRESGLNIWAFADKENLDLNAIKSLIASSSIFDRQSFRMESGQKVYTEGTQTFPDVIVPWVRNPDQDSPSFINHQYINECFSLINKVNNIVLDTKLVSKLSITDKANTKALRELMADLNRCVTSSFDIDQTGGNATISYRKGKQIVSIRLSDIRQLMKTQGLDNQMVTIRNLNDYSLDPWSDLLNKLINNNK
jgi:hypothetical protein